MHTLAARAPFRSLTVLAAIAAFAVSLVGCANSPVALAQTPEQKYAATKLTLDAVLEAAVVIVEDQSAPVEVRRAVQQAAASAREIYRNANDAYVKFIAAKGELAAGQTATEKLTIATANLDRWLGDLDTISRRVAALSSR